MHLFKRRRKIGKQKETRPIIVSSSERDFSQDFFEGQRKAWMEKKNAVPENVFENFDLTTGNVDLSRHTLSHGYANANDFNKAKALQAILILDQIYFYL